MATGEERDELLGGKAEIRERKVYLRTPTNVNTRAPPEYKISLLLNTARTSRDEDIEV
jgi:hypothetical protein